jgi:hypothetical protein
MPYRLVSAPPPARKAFATRVADGLRNRAGVLLALAVALATVAGAAAVVAPPSREAAALSARGGPAPGSTLPGRAGALAPGAGHRLAATRTRSAARSSAKGATPADTPLAAASSPEPASSTSAASAAAAGSGAFPGAPEAGHIIRGAAVGLNSDPGGRQEVPTGTPLAIHRLYVSAGAGDLAVPGGPVARAILADQSAGRIPLVSVKPGPFASTAAGAYDSQFRAFFAWTERQAEYTCVIVDHEPENDLKGAPMAAQVQLASDFRHAQERVRADLDAVTGGHATRTSFGGSLMTYGDTPYAEKGFARRTSSSRPPVRGTGPAWTSTPSPPSHRPGRNGPMPWRRPAATASASPSPSSASAPPTRSRRPG